VRVFRGEGFWRTAVECGGNVTHHDFNDGVTDVRPLIVLDLGTSVPAVVVNVLRKACYYRLADQVEQQTKPRIPEPEWGQKVTASTKGGKRREFVHAFHQSDVGTVWTDARGFHAAWSDLIDPEAVPS
jgi:hypothetical protein